MFSPEVVPINVVIDGGFTTKLAAVAEHIAAADGEQHEVVMETVITEVRLMCLQNCI